MFLYFVSFFFYHVESEEMIEERGCLMILLEMAALWVILCLTAAIHSHCYLLGIFKILNLPVCSLIKVDLLTKTEHWQPSRENGSRVFK